MGAAIGPDAVGAGGQGAARWGSDAAEDHRLAPRQGGIGIRGVGRDPRQTCGSSAAAVRVARVLERVAHVDAAVACELRIERQAPEPAVVVGVHLGAQVDERRRQQLPVLDHSDDAVLLPHEQASVGSEGHADQGVRRNRGDPLGCEPRSGEGVRGGGALEREQAGDHADRRQPGIWTSPDDASLGLLALPCTKHRFGSNVGAVFDGSFASTRYSQRADTAIPFTARAPTRPSISVHQPHLERRRTARDGRAGPADEREDAGDVGLGLGIVGDAAARGDRGGAGVVCGERQ